MTAPGYDGSIKIDTNLSTKGFNKGVASMMGSIKSIGLAIGVAFSAVALVNFGRAAVSEASKMEAAFIGLRSIVEGTGNSYARAQEFIERFVYDGLVPATYAVTAYKNLLMRGYSVEQIETVLDALKNSAAFGRQASLTLGEAIASATEGLKNENSILVDNAGVTKNVSMMWKDYAASIGTTVGALTKAQKIQAEVNGIMQETRFQTGDAAKLVGTFSGKVSALGVAWLNFKVAVGNAVIPVLNALLPVILAVVNALTILFNIIGRIVNAFFGTDVSMADTAEGAADAADAAEQAADAEGDLADSTAEAEEAAKGALAAFDELNVLQADSAAAGATDTTDELTDALEVPPLDTSAAQDAIDPLTAKIQALKEAMQPLFDVLTAGWGVLQAALEALKPVWQWIWDNLLAPLGRWTGEVILQALTWLAEKLNALSAWIRANPEKFQTIAVVIGLIAAAILITMAATAAWTAILGIASAVGTAFGAVMAFITSPIFLVVVAIIALIAIIVALIHFWPQITEAAGAAWGWIVQKWGELASWFKAKVIDPIADFFEPLFEFIYILAHDYLALVKFVWGAAAQWFTDHVTRPLAEAFSEAWAIVRRYFADAWNNFKAVWAPIGDWVRVNVTEPLRTAFFKVLEDLYAKWQTVFSGLLGVGKAAINSIIRFLNGLIDGVVSGINAIINALNAVGSAVPDWILIPNVSGFNIPYLARGAVIPPNSQFLAVLGDQTRGRNIEAPEDLIRQVVADELRNAQGSSVLITFEGSLAPLARVLKPHFKREEARVGRSLVAGDLTW